MTSQRWGKLLKNTKGREVAYFTTPSGVEAVEIAAQKNDEDPAAGHGSNSD